MAYIYVMSAIYMSLADFRRYAILAIRERRLNQTTLAREAGISPGVLSQFLNGASIKPDLARRLMSALGLDPDPGVFFRVTPPLDAPPISGGISGSGELPHGGF